MAINFASMMLQPTPAKPWDFGGGESSTAREQLKLAREQFEWNKKKTEEDRRIAREAAAAEAAKEKLAAEAAKEAKLREDRLKAFGDFTKAGGEGNVQAMAAQAPLLHALGMGIELEGETGGLPRYRVDMDAAAAQKAEDERLAQTSPYGEGETAEQSLSRLSAMGLGGELGSLEPPLGIRASDEVDPATGATVADRVAATYGTPGEKTATREPDVEDFTGGVPKNVIDMGAMAAATLHRLNPTLEGMVAAFPDEETQRGAESIRQGLRSSGLPFEKQMELFDKGIGPVATQRNAQIGAQAQADRFREQRDELTETQAFQFEKAGRDDADKFATDNKIYDMGKALRAGDTILDVIDDDNPDNDAMIASELMTFQNVKGTPSDTDLKLAFDIPMSATMDQALNIIGKMVLGGMQPVQKEAIKAYIAAKREELKRGAFEYLDQANARAAGGAYNERARKAYLQTIKGSVPGFVYNEYLDMRKARDEGPGGDRGKKTAELSAAPNADLAEMSDFDLELEGQALENDLDPEKIRRIIGPESGGDPKAVSSAGASGVLQIMPDHLRRMGIEPEEFRKLSATEQLPYVVKFFQSQGITSESSADDYALAVAASDPKWRSSPDSTVIYPKGSKAWEQNKPWRPADGGDITKESILRFYGLRGGGKDKGADKALPEPKTPAEKRYLELLKKRGN